MGGVNFTIPKLQSTNVATQEVWHNQFYQQNCAKIYQLTKLKVMPTTLYAVHQPSISSMFYSNIFRMKFWRQKYQSCVLGLKCFGAKILYKKWAHKMLMKLTAER